MNEKKTFEEYGVHILSEINRLNNNCERIFVEIGNIRVEVGQLKVKSGFWGLIVGMIPVLILILVHFVNGLR